MSDPQKPGAEQKPLTPIAYTERGLQLSTLDDAWRFANMVISSNLAPRAFDKPEKIIIACQKGAELGMGPMEALESFSVIQGKATLSSEAALGLCWKSKLLIDIEETSEGHGDDMVAVCRMRRVNVEGWKEVRFSMADAKRAGLLKNSVYKSYPQRMLQHRARCWLMRDLFPDALRGTSITEEVRDIPGQHVEREAPPPDAAPDPAILAVTDEPAAAEAEEPEYAPDSLEAACAESFEKEKENGEVE